MWFKPWTNEDIHVSHNSQGNYGHKMNACRFKCVCICVFISNETADKHNGNGNFIILLLIKSKSEKKGKRKWSLCVSLHLHTLDKQCWRFSMGNTWTCLVCLRFFALLALFMRFGVIKIAMFLRSNRRTSCYSFSSLIGQCL